MALERGDLAFVLGLSGFLLGGIGAYLGYRTVDTERKLRDYHDVQIHDGEMMDSIINRLTAIERATSGAAGHAPVTAEDIASLRSDLSEANKRISAAAQDAGFGRDEIAGLRARLAEIEKRLPPK